MCKFQTLEGREGGGFYSDDSENAESDHDEETALFKETDVQDCFVATRLLDCAAACDMIRDGEDDQSVTKVPRQRLAPLKAVQVACGGQHSLALTADKVCVLVCVRERYTQRACENSCATGR